MEKTTIRTYCIAWTCQHWSGMWSILDILTAKQTSQGKSTSTRLVLMVVKSLSLVGSRMALVSIRYARLILKRANGPLSRTAQIVQPSLRRNPELVTQHASLITACMSLEAKTTKITSLTISGALTWAPIPGHVFKLKAKSHRPEPVIQQLYTKARFVCLEAFLRSLRNLTIAIFLTLKKIYGSASLMKSKKTVALISRQPRLCQWGLFPQC